jgi:O-ureido-D-serine cyclo-ligase
MVQEYMPSVEGPGEVDLVFLDGAFSHAVRKKPFLRKGEGVVDRPWERMSWAGLTATSPSQVELADRTLGLVAARLGCSLAYGRVDLVDGRRGEPLVLEVEVVDPYLSLGSEPTAADRLARALMRSPDRSTPGP